MNISVEDWAWARWYFIMCGMEHEGSEDFQGIADQAYADVLGFGINGKYMFNHLWFL